MYATLARAAIHSFASRGGIDTVLFPEQLISELKAKSIKHLRHELQGPTWANRTAQLAAIRTLCQCEIHSGSDGSSPWRVHVNGAKALMDSLEKSSSPRKPQPRLLNRWYQSLRSLATLAPYERGSSVTPSTGFTDDLTEEYPEDIYLDDYNGYSTDLSFILGRIGSISEAKRQDDGRRQSDYWDTQAEVLERSLYKIMERDNSSAPTFYPGVAEKLSPEAVLEYSLCNQAYQHTATLLIQRRIRNLPSCTPQIDESVKTIIDCASGIVPAYGLSPAIVLTTPLFTAGCEALGKDRAAIREQLKRLYDMLKIRNIQLTLEVLENYWADKTEGGDWEGLLGMCLPFPTVFIHF